MLCKIADLLVDIPDAGDLVPRCREYLFGQDAAPDICIDPKLFRTDAWDNLSEENMIYMESGCRFYLHLLSHNGMMLHASAVELDGKAYLFSGPCGTGKSTHTRLWQKTFGEAAQVFNDDKPALRRLEDGWYAYGTPWCGKDGINQNKKVPLAGICFLKQAPHNRIRRLAPNEAVQKVLSQTLRKFTSANRVQLLLENVDRLVREIPVYEMENLPEADAARLSLTTMRRGAEEINYETE